MYKLLNIPPEYLPDHGDCLSSIFFKLFLYYKIDGFGKLFYDAGHLAYVPCQNPHLPFNTNINLKLPQIDYFERVKVLYNIHTRTINPNIIDNIISSIDNETPIVMCGRAIDMPWRHCQNTDEYHACLIIGYNSIDQCFICLDPIFEGGLLKLPYNNIRTDDEKTQFKFLDVSETKKNSDFDNYCFRDYFRSLDQKEYSWSCFANLCTDIIKKDSIGLLFIENYENYLLNNVTWFFLRGRSAKIALFFTYLSETIPNEKINEIIKLAKKCIVTIGIASTLVVRYSRTGEKQLISKVIEKILECAVLERSMSELIITHNISP